MINHTNAAINMVAQVAQCYYSPKSDLQAANRLTKQRRPTNIV